MLWIAVLALALSAVSFRLGALSVLITVFSSGLLAALLVIAGFVVVLLWRRFFGSKA
jgi:hypothetical protein